MISPILWLLSYDADKISHELPDIVEQSLIFLTNTIFMIKMFYWKA